MENEKKIRVLLADDQSILADGIRSVLSSCDEIEVVGIAADGFEALELLEKCKPDVILMDIRMPNMNGVIATQEVKRRHPEVKVLILTTFDDSDYILNAINNGASGYLLKDTSSAALIDAIRNAYAGDTILPAKIARRIADAAKMVSTDREIRLKRAFSLSDREVEIALMIYEGFTNKQIASALKLTDGTSRNYISAIYVKLGVSSRGDAVAKMKEAIS
ncbi:MAG TPA: response regulator transcription factor [Firmicutes bacterium]|nr:response regulator transcription factor [Bacillota bacterium]